MPQWLNSALSKVKEKTKIVGDFAKGATSKARVSLRFMRPESSELSASDLVQSLKDRILGIHELPDLCAVVLNWSNSVSASLDGATTYSGHTQGEVFTFLQLLVDSGCIVSLLQAIYSNSKLKEPLYSAWKTLDVSSGAEESRAGAKVDGTRRNSEQAGLALTNLLYILSRALITDDKKLVSDFLGLFLCPHGGDQNQSARLVREKILDLDGHIREAEAGLLKSLMKSVPLDVMEFHSYNLERDIKTHALAPEASGRDRLDDVGLHECLVRSVGELAKAAETSSSEAVTRSKDLVEKVKHSVEAAIEANGNTEANAAAHRSEGIAGFDSSMTAMLSERQQVDTQIINLEQKRRALRDELDRVGQSIHDLQKSQRDLMSKEEEARTRHTQFLEQCANQERELLDCRKALNTDLDVMSVLSRVANTAVLEAEKATKESAQSASERLASVTSRRDEVLLEFLVWLEKNLKSSIDDLKRSYDMLEEVKQVLSVLQQGTLDEKPAVASELENRKRRHDSLIKEHTLREAQCQALLQLLAGAEEYIADSSSRFVAAQATAIRELQAGVTRYALSQAPSLAETEST